MSDAGKLIPKPAIQLVLIRSDAAAANSSVTAANAMVQIGSPGKKAFMMEPITVATSNCGSTTKMLNNPISVSYTHLTLPTKRIV